MRAGLKPAPTDEFPNNYALSTMDFPNGWISATIMNYELFCGRIYQQNEGVSK